MTTKIIEVQNGLSKLEQKTFLVKKRESKDMKVFLKI